MKSDSENRASKRAPSKGSAWRAVAWCLVIAVTAAAVVVCRFSPAFVNWRGLYLADPPQEKSEFIRAKSSLAQLHAPWSPVTKEVNQVIEWRLLFPLVWHYVRLPPGLYLAMPQIGCVLACWLVAWLVHRQLGNWPQTWMITALFATLPWFFVSAGWLAYFDSWLVIGLVAAAFVPSRWVLGLACALTPWIDERFLLALPVTLLVRAIALQSCQPANTPENRQGRPLLLDLAVAVAASLPYPTIRALVWLHGDAASTSYLRFHWQHACDVPLTTYLAGLWSGYRAAWLLIGATVWFTARRLNGLWGTALGLLVAGSAVGGLFIAADMSRTLMMVCPVALLGAMLWGRYQALSFRYALPSLLLANLLLPAAHVMWFVTHPIHSLPTEVYNWQNPPLYFAAAELFAQGNDLANQGQFRAARDRYDAAIELDPGMVSLFVCRAMVNVRLNDLAAVAHDLDAALQLEPRNPAALYLRASLLASQGNTSPTLIDDVQYALEHAPQNWPLRKEAEALLRYLKDRNAQQ